MTSCDHGMRFPLYFVFLHVCLSIIVLCPNCRTRIFHLAWFVCVSVKKQKWNAIEQQTVKCKHNAIYINDNVNLKPEPTEKTVFLYFIVGVCTSFICMSYSYNYSQLWTVMHMCARGIHFISVLTIFLLDFWVILRV